MLATLEFLRPLAHRYGGREGFLMIDDAPCHPLDEESRAGTSVARCVVSSSHA